MCFRAEKRKKCARSPTLSLNICDDFTRAWVSLPFEPQRTLESDNGLPMTDISDAVDLLLAGVVPERVGEIKAEWSSKQDRVRLQDSHGFVMQQIYGTIQVNELALKQIWFIGFACQKAIEAYSGNIVAQQFSGQPCDTSELTTWADRNGTDLFADRMRLAKELANAECLEDFDWPNDVPYPVEGAPYETINDKAIFDLVCMAGAYIFLHEIRHSLIWQSATTPMSMISEEVECDHFALNMMIGRIPKYSAESGYPKEHVLAKRLLGIIFAKIVILVVTPQSRWKSSSDHPPVANRIRTILDAADDSIPEDFWLASAAILVALAEYFRLLNSPVAFTSSRDLAYKMCELIGQSD